MSLRHYTELGELHEKRKGEFHHKHNHSNSFLSGVFYVKVEEDMDQIMFFKEGYSQVKLEARVLIFIIRTVGSLRLSQINLQFFLLL